MKVLANETKRILAVLLSVAMIFAYVPNNVMAYADEPSDNEVEAAVEETTEPQTEQATEQGGSGEGETSKPSDDYYADTNLISAGTKTHIAFVTLAGDVQTAVGNSGTAAAGGTSLTGDKDGITAVDTGQGDWVGYTALDSDYGISGYVVAEYGYTLPALNELEVTVTGNYHDTELGKDVSIKENTDYVIGAVTDSLKYLNEDCQYEWSKAIPVTIKGSKENSTFLKKYSEYGPIAANKKYLSLWVKGTATENEVPFTVTVDGVKLVSGYKAMFTSTNTTEFSITDSVKAEFLDKYNVNVALVDGTGTERIKYVQNTAGKNNAGTDGKGDCMDGSRDEYAFYLSNDGKLSFSTYGIKQAYKNIRDNQYVWKVEFTKKQDYVENYTIVADSVTYAKIRQGESATTGNEVKTTVGKANTDCVHDELFFVDPIQGSERTIKKVEYFIEGMSDKAETVAYDTEHDVIVGEKYYNYNKVKPVAAAELNDLYEKDGVVYTKTTDETIVADKTYYARATFNSDIQPSSDPKTEGYYEKLTDPADTYTKSEDTTVDTGKTYYKSVASAGTVAATGTPKVYCIPFDDHIIKEDSTPEHVHETHEGNITLFVTTDETVAYTLPLTGGTSNVAITDNVTGSVATIGGAATNPVKVTAETNKKYSFTVTPKEGFDIDTVTASMIGTPTGKDTNPITLTDNNFGSYTIANVTGKVEITVRVKESNKTLGVQLYSDPTGICTVKEKSSGTQIPYGTTAPVAELNKPFEFVVAPDAGISITKVEYTMGEEVTEFAKLTPVTTKIDGSRVYKIPEAKGGITLKVTQGTSVNVTKVENKDAVLTYNGVVIDDGEAIAADTDEDLSFSVAGKTGVEVKGVYYAADGIAINKDNYKTNATELKSTSGVYTIGNSSLTAGTDLNVYIVTEKTAAASSYKAEIASALDGKSSVDSLALRAGGVTMTAAAVDAATRVYDELTAVFKNPNGTVINGTFSFKTGIAETSKNALVKITQATNVGKIQTTNKTGTDTITVELKDDTTAWPAATVYSKEIAVTTTPLSTMFDKVELSSVVTEQNTKPGLTKDSKTIRTKDGTDINDKIDYSIYGYTTKDGKSVKATDPIANTDIGATEAITSIEWKGNPPVADTVKADDKAYVLAPQGSGETATISTALEPNSVDVTATLYFADGSELDTAAETLTIADKEYGYVAIPTIKTAGASLYNGHYLEVETVGSIKSSDIAWSVYKVMNKTAYTAIVGATTDLPTGAATLTKKQVDNYLAKGSLEPASNVQYGTSKLDPANGIVTVTDGANSKVTAVKKGNAELYLKATVDSMPVASAPIYVNVVNNITTYEVLFDAQASTYNSSVTPTSKPEYVASVKAYTTFDEGGDIADKYKYPTFDDNVAIKKLGTVSEIVDNPKATVKHSVGFALTDIKDGTSFPLPGEDAFKAGTISPKVELYGWLVVDQYGKEFHNIGDTVEIVGNTVIEPLWAYKYYSNDSTYAGINVYRYDGGATSAVAEADEITIAKSTTAKQIAIPFAVGYHEIDTKLGPDDDGYPQYDVDETITTDGLELKTAVGDSGLVASQLKKGILQTLDGTALPAAGEALTVEFTDGTGDDAAVYKVQGTTGSYNISVGTLTAKSTTADTTYTIEFEDPTVELEAGQTETYTATVKKEGVAVANWNDAFVSVKASVATADKTTLEPEDVDLTSAGKVSVTGLASRTAPVTVTVRATDANGNYGEGTFAATVKPSSVDIIPVVEWTDEDGFKYTEEQSSDKLYLRANVENTVTWKAKKNGALVDTSNAFGFVDTTDTDELEKNGEIYYDPTVKPNTASGADSMAVTPKAFGVGEITVAYTESTGKIYTKVIPVVTYQAVTIVAPTDALKPVYSVFKNGTALEAGKNLVEKIVYQKGKASYTFDSKPYTSTWIADTTTTYDLYQWNKDDTNVKITAGVPGIDATKLDDTYKSFDLEEKITLSAAEWEATATGYQKLAACYGSKKVDLSNLPDTITLSDETLSVKDTSNGTDVAVIKMGVTPYDSANVVSVTGSDYDMYLLGVGDRGQTATTTADRVYPYEVWAPDIETPGNGSKINENTGDQDKEELLSALVSPDHVGSKIAGKARTDTFTVAKINDAAKSKKYVGESTITVIANGGDYKAVTLYINGEFDTGRKNSDNEEIFQYMKNGEILQNGVEIVQGEKHYYKDGARVNNGIFNEGGKLMLINGGAQVTTPGRTTFDGKNYYIGSDSYIITNQKFTGLVTSGVNKDNDKSYSADENGVLAQSVLVKNADGTANYYDNNCQMAVAPSTANEYANIADTNYYVNAAGNVALGNIFKVEGVDRLFTEEGKIVTYADTIAAGTPGKLTVAGIGYVIAEDNSAKRDDILYNPVVTLSAFPTKWYKSSNAYPVITYTGTVTSKNTGKQIPISGNAVVSTEPWPVSTNAIVATFTASVDLSQYFEDEAGTKPVTKPATKDATYRFKDGGDEGISDVYYDPVIKWDKWPKTWDKGTLYPTVTYSLTYTSANTGEKTTVNNIIAVGQPTAPITTSANKVTFVATANLSGYSHDKEGKVAATADNTKNVTTKQEYKFKKDSPSGNQAGGESGSSESEPEQSEVTGAAQNLWYTDVELTVPLESATYKASTEKGKTKWTAFYDVDTATGAVTVKGTKAADRKKGASAANSKIYLDVVDSEGNKTGEFVYQLPVFFQKPSLKLSAKNGTVLKGTGGVVKTKVLEKKSNGMYEALDLSDQKSEVKLYDPKNASVVTDVTSEDNEVQITATGKTAGKVQVQLDNWCEAITLSYAIKESTKPVLTFDKTKVTMNSNTSDGAEQSVFLSVNGSEWNGEEVSVTYPKNFDQKNVVIEGVTEGKVTDAEIKVGYKSGSAPVKGNYTITFKSGGATAKLKIAVSNAKLADKAVTASVKTKMDITKKQKLVLEPKFKGIEGEVSDVATSETGALSGFDVEYNEDTNQILVAPADDDWSKVTANQAIEGTIGLKVGGVLCGIKVKTKATATKPTVVVNAVTLPKDKVKVSGNNIGGEANILCTYKTGGKTFTTDFEKFEFVPKNGDSFDSSTGYYTFKNGATCRVFVNKEHKVVVEDYQSAKGKGNSVKIKFTFAGGKTVTKTFTIKTK